MIHPDLNRFSHAILARLSALPHTLHELPISTLALRLVESIGQSDAVDVGLYAMLLYGRGVNDEELAKHALTPLLDVLRKEISHLENAELQARIAEPYGYWLDGEWYGYTPEEQALREGQTITLTPVWTHNNGVTFIGTAAEGSDEVNAVPATSEDAALLRPFLTNEGA